MARTEPSRRRLGRVVGWPLALAVGLCGFLVWMLQTATGAAERNLAIPARTASLAESLAFWLYSGCYALPVVLAVLFLALVAGASLSGLAIFGPQPFSTLLRRLHELGGAVPLLLLLMLWRIGEVRASSVGFVVLSSAMFSVEIAQLLTETGRRLEQGQVGPEQGVGVRWQRFLRDSVSELRSQLATQAALVASAVFGLDAALAFVGLGLDGVPTWGRVIGDSARLANVPSSVLVLSLLGTLVTVFGAYRLLSVGPGPATPRSAGSE